MRRLAAAGRLALLELLARRRRILALLAFAGLFLAAGATAAALGRRDGHVEMDALYQLGGYPLVSGLLLTGWLLGRFPLLATLVLMSGVISADDAAGHRRLLATRPVRPQIVYGLRFLALDALAFAIAAILMPLFDLIMLGQWAGPATLVLILAHVMVWGSLVALFSVFTTLDAWLALLAALFALVWAALSGAGMLPVTPLVAEIVTFVLPPQEQLLALESAFGELEPIPWGAFWFCMGYSAVALLLAGALVGRREI